MLCLVTQFLAALTDWLTLHNLDIKSDFRDLRPFRHLIRVMSWSKDTKIKGSKDQKASSIPLCQGSFALFRCFKGSLSLSGRNLYSKEGGEGQVENVPQTPLRKDLVGEKQITHLEIYIAIIFCDLLRYLKYQTKTEITVIWKISRMGGEREMI